MTNPRKDHGTADLDLSRARWRTSTYSGGNGDCVEVASLDGAIAVRDSKDRRGLVLMWRSDEWGELMRKLREYS